MGFVIYYRSTRAVTAAEAAVIESAAAELVRGRTWLSCEPVLLSVDAADGHLVGGSKPNFVPDADDAAAAVEETLPDGTTQDLLNILCDVSRACHVDWEISHDHSNGVVGYIRGGVCERQVQKMINAFADLSGILGEFLPELKSEEESFREREVGRGKRRDDPDDEDGPSILKFRPKGS